MDKQSEDAKAICEEEKIRSLGTGRLMTTSNMMEQSDGQEKIPKWYRSKRPIKVKKGVRMVLKIQHVQDILTASSLGEECGEEGAEGSNEEQRDGVRAYWRTVAFFRSNRCLRGGGLIIRVVECGNTPISLCLRNDGSFYRCIFQILSL